MNRQAHWLALLALAALVAPLLSGCGAQGPQIDKVPHALRFQPETDQKVLVSPGLSAPPPSADVLTGGSKLADGDPLAGGADPMGQPGNFSSQDPLAGAGTNNWYWLRGSIRGGAVDVVVDGVPFGRFSVHMDKEITRMLHPGVNTITFTSERDNPQSPVQAHLEVVFSQMAPGMLPPLVYDTSTLPSSAPTMPKAAPSLYKKPTEHVQAASNDSSGSAGSTNFASAPALAGSTDAPPPPDPYDSSEPAAKPVLPAPALALPGSDPPTTLTFVAQ